MSSSSHSPVYHLDQYRIHPLIALTQDADSFHSLSNSPSRHSSTLDLETRIDLLEHRLNRGVGIQVRSEHRAKRTEAAHITLGRWRRITEEYWADWVYPVQRGLILTVSQIIAVRPIVYYPAVILNADFLTCGDAVRLAFTCTTIHEDKELKLSYSAAARKIEQDLIQVKARNLLQALLEAPDIEEIPETDSDFEFNIDEDGNWTARY